MDEFVVFLDFRLNLGHGIPDLLTEKLDFAYGFFWTMHLSNRLDSGEVSLNLVLDARGQPALVLAVNTVVKARRTMARLSIPAGTTQLPAGGEQVNDVRA